jgi:hypothetical protein
MFYPYFVDIGVYIHADPFFKTVVDIGFTAITVGGHVLYHDTGRVISADIFQGMGYDGVLMGINTPGW